MNTKQAVVLVLGGAIAIFLPAALHLGILGGFLTGAVTGIITSLLLDVLD